MVDSLRTPHTQPPPVPTYPLTPSEVEALAMWSAGAYLGPEDEMRLALENGGTLPAGYIKEPPFEIVCPPPEISPFAMREDGEPEGE